MKINWGRCDGSLEEQLNKQGFTLRQEAKRWENIKEARFMLKVYGLLTKKEQERILNRMNKNIAKDIYELIETEEDKE